MQHEALATALSDIFWKTGSNTSAFVCLPHQTQSFVQTSHKFNEDGITERVNNFLSKNYICCSLINCKHFSWFSINSIVTKNFSLL